MTAVSTLAFTIDSNIAQALYASIATNSLSFQNVICDKGAMGGCFSDCLNGNHSSSEQKNFLEDITEVEEEDDSSSDIFYDAVQESDEYDWSAMSLVESLRGGDAQPRHHSFRGYAFSAKRSAKQPPPPPRAPPPPKELPLRFLRAGKGDPDEGLRRYESTLAWRKEHRMDTILTEPFPYFELIKKHYPHYFHLRGKNNEPVYIEMPPKTDLKALRAGGVDIDMLLRHYAMVTEFMWQYVERDDFARSIYVIDLEGIGITDFVGECVDFVRQASAFCNKHYPERAGFIMVINVPSWFKIIWNVVKNFADEVTLKKIHILRGKDEIFKTMCEKIPIENIPPEYGGQSVPLGQAPEERLLWDLVRHNNNMEQHGIKMCGGYKNNCPFCTFIPERSY